MTQDIDVRERDALLVYPDECRCGHDRDQHHADGTCKRYQGEPTPVAGTECMVTYPPGACYCKEFDNEPWRWGVWECYSPPFPTHVDEDGKEWTSFGGTEPDSYTVQRQNRSKTYGPYKSRSTAERKCEELNRLMLFGPLDPEFAKRYKRLKRLAPDYGYLYDGLPEGRWPMRPEKYLIDGFDDGWHGEEWHRLVDTLDGVREVLESATGHEVMRVIDLDTGDEVGFERRVAVYMHTD